MSAVPATASRWSSRSHDFGGSVLDRPIEVLQGDDQNKPDVSSSLAREWIDSQGVDVLADGAASSAGLAIQQVGREKKRVYLITGPATSDMTGKQCSPYGFHFAYDTYALAQGTGTRADQGRRRHLVLHHGRLRVRLRAGARHHRRVQAAGGKVLGSVRAPLGTADFSSYLIQAKASGAKVYRLRQRGHRPAELHQAGGRVRPVPGRHAHGDAADGDQRCALARPEDLRGAGLHGLVLLGHDRQDARLVEALERQDEAGPRPAARRETTARRRTG